MTPEPPPGYRLLTDEEKTKPLPMDALCFRVELGDVGEWGPSFLSGQHIPPSNARTYATRATPELESLRAEVERLNNQLVVISAIVAETMPKEPENFIHQVESYAAERLQEQRELTRLRAELEQWKKWGGYACKRFTEETGKDLQAQSA